jgi:SecD/SecF fusion protein
MFHSLGRRALIAILIIGAAAVLVTTREARLGLDLRGGTQIVLEAKDTPERKADRDAVERSIEVLRRRVDQLGVAEPALQRSGERRIIVELPGVQDPDEAQSVIGRTAQLTFHSVLGIADRSGEAEAGKDDTILRDESGTPLRLGPAVITGDAVGNARAVLNSDEFGPSLGWAIDVSFRGDSGDRWARLTGQAACSPPGDPKRRIAIVLDRDVISSPQVSPEIQCRVGITGGRTSITGSFTEREAKDLALLIRAGALPVPVEVVERRTIGPTLGEAAIDASVKAAMIGAALTIVYMLAYYRLLGAMAAIALLLYGLLSYAALLAIGATLTLPGIAGFVLAIGMAVDANVLVFERIKEEQAAGRSLGFAAITGFKRAWSAIADSNATTLLAAILLFYLASGAVRGFGVTLSIGVVVSMFTALVVTRLLVELLLRSARIRSRPNVLGMRVGERFKRRLAERSPDVVGKARIWFAVSAAVLILAVAGLALRGLSLGLEFHGGRLLEYATDRPSDIDLVRRELADRGFPRAVVQESGDGNVSVRTAQLTSAEEGRVREAVAAVGGGVEELRDEFIGATISGELLRKAVIALGLALGAQLIYLAFRFRWTYGASAVAAMFHDVAILLGVFAWLGKEIDGVFVAALLTVIGYSINDSVVVFDRVREQRAARANEPLVVVANDACMQTVPRTINTGMGALFILGALYVLGGDTLKDFALALIVGILVGTYSSVFTAAPLAVTMERWGGGEDAPVRTAPDRKLAKAGQSRSDVVRPRQDRARPRAGGPKRVPATTRKQRRRR